MNTAKILKALRIRMGLTQNQFAVVVGVRQSHISRSERDGYPSDLKYMQQVADKTGKKLIMHYGR